MKFIPGKFTMLSGAVMTAILTAGTIAAQAATTAPPALGKPTLKSIQPAAPAFEANQPINVAVNFEGQQCVFNLQLNKSGGGAGYPQTQGWYFNNAGQLSWTLNLLAVFSAIGPGDYQVVAQPNSNSGPTTAPRCTGGPVSASFSVRPPARPAADTTPTRSEPGNTPPPTTTRW